MSIEKKIKEAFKQDKKLREANRWDPDSQPNLYELQNFLRKSGYRLVDVLTENGKIELIVEAVESNHLHPEILHDIKDNNFYIKVTEHGLLVASDVEEIIKGYSNALGVVNYLGKLDLKKLEINNEEEESED